MAKKILAVVLAVMMAVSAMAVTAFADDYKIPLRAATSINNGTYKAQITFDIPVYGFYGYLTAGDYMELDLPTYFGDSVPAGLDIAWYLQIDGSKYLLQASKTTAAGAAISENENKVYLGVLGHDFNGTDTTIPQSIAYNQYSSFRLVCEIDKIPYVLAWGDKYTGANAKGLTDVINVGDLFNGNSPKYGRPASQIKADWFKSDDTPVPGSTSYVFSWPTTVADLNSAPTSVTDFVSEEWDNTLDWGNVATGAKCPLTWDHTIEARSHIYSYTGTTAQLVVELAKPIVGQATYTLWARNNNTSAFGTVNPEGLWWNYAASRTLVDTQTVNEVTGPVSTLTFNVPMSFLYDGTYGAYNTEFAICENITLMNQTIMADYRHADTSKAGENKSVGLLSWGAKTWQGEPVIKLNGVEVNYARTGKAGAVGADVTATNLYIVLPEIAEPEPEEEAGVDQPTQGTDQDGESEGDDSMNAGDTDDTPTEGEGEATPAPEDTTPAPSESENPPTGIALAVIPMILAAAAAVVAKKH